MPSKHQHLLWSLIPVIILALTSALLIWKSNLYLREELMFVGMLFIINALMNIFWSFLFFYAHMIGFAVIEAGALVLSVLALILYIYPASLLAAALLLPYFFWSSFATYLTYSIWKFAR